MEIHGVISHLVAKTFLVEKQNKQILAQLARLNRKGEENIEDNGEHKEREEKRMSWQLERRRRSRSKSGDSWENIKIEEKGEDRLLKEVSCFVPDFSLPRRSKEI